MVLNSGRFLCRVRRNEYKRQDYHKNKDKIAAAEMLRRYGITPEEYETLLASQRGCCAICGVDQCRSGRRLAIDHDHATGAVRGLLCANCNGALGLLYDDAERLKKAIAYLEPAK